MAYKIRNRTQAINQQIWNEYQAHKLQLNNFCFDRMKLDFTFSTEAKKQSSVEISNCKFRSNIRSNKSWQFLKADDWIWIIV